MAVLLKGRPCDSNIHRAQVDIMSYPAGKILLEALKNSWEAGATEFRIRATIILGTRKVEFLDNGKGMDADVLGDVGMLYVSHKPDAGYDGHHGVGLMISAYKFNNNGVTIQSCAEVDGEFLVNEVRLGAILAEGGQETWGYIPYKDDDEDYFVRDITEDLEPQIHSWTKITLLGNSDDQDTVSFPYGHNGVGTGKHSWPNDFRQNFFDIPGMAVVFDASTNIVGDRKTGPRSERTVSWRESLEKNHYNHYPVDVIDPESGATLRIHYISEIYIRTDDGGHLKSSDGYEKRFSGEGKTVSGIICPDGVTMAGQMFRNEWQGKAIKAGFYSKPNNYMVMVEVLKTDKIVFWANRDRTKIAMGVAKSPMFQEVTIEHFFSLIRANLPKEIKDEMENRASTASNSEHWAKLFEHIHKTQKKVLVNGEVEQQIEVPAPGDGGSKTVIDIDTDNHSGENPVKPGAPGGGEEDDGGKGTQKRSRRAKGKVERLRNSGVPIAVVEIDNDAESIGKNLARFQIDGYGGNNIPTILFNRVAYKDIVMEQAEKFGVSFEDAQAVLETDGFGDILYRFVCGHYLKGDKNKLEKILTPDALDGFIHSNPIWFNDAYRKEILKRSKVADLKDHTTVTLQAIVDTK
jgi:histidine kinase/DNA gyrase B/HSP90-like ATPase